MDCTSCCDLADEAAWLRKAPPRIPTIGPWEPAATGGILYLQRCKTTYGKPARLKFDPQFPTKVFTNRRKSGTVAKCRLPICHGKSEPKNNKSADLSGVPISSFSKFFIIHGEEMVFLMHTDACNYIFCMSTVWKHHAKQINDTLQTILILSSEITSIQQSLSSGFPPKSFTRLWTSNSWFIGRTVSLSKSSLFQWCEQKSTAQPVQCTPKKH